MKTYSTKPSDIKRTWHVIDAKDQILGRLATDIATKLIGKDKPYFVSHLDCGDYVVITNAEKIAVTGDKLNQKTYYHHSGYPGGLKEEVLKDRLNRSPLKVIEHAVRGMLPKNKLRDQRLRRLKVFVGPEHTYQDKLKSKSTK